MKYLTVLFLIILLSISLFAQYPNRQVVKAQPFAQGDSAQFIQQITGIDSVYWRGVVGSNTNPTDWTMFSNTITAAEKTTESTQFFYIANETNWYWYESVQFKVEQGDSSITSQWIQTANSAGRLTYAIRLDTVGTTTYYYDDLGGN